jgi:leucyl/phenylalanyl-tRNA--protein transferase
MEQLTPWILRYGYEQGLFPMAEDDGEIAWFSSRLRALVPIEGIHVSKSFRRFLNQTDFRVSYDRDFEAVMRGCKENRDTWISEEMVQVYIEVHREGWAHSCEVWSGEDLIGGIYGVAIGGIFCGESMFSRVSNASKFGLFHLVNQVRSLGFIAFDAQFINEHTQSLGAYEIPEADYLALLERGKRIKTPWSGQAQF